MFAGIDIGSLVTKVVLLDDGDVISYSIVDSRTDPRRAGQQAMRNALDQAGCCAEEVLYTIVTGYGRVAFPNADRAVTELSCHARGAAFLCPRARTVIDIGGQDSKVIKLDEQGDMMDFKMNDKCAAGTGRFLEVMSRALEIGLDDLGDSSLRSETTCPLSSTCTVFAESEVISLIASGSRKEDIVAGIHNSIARRVGNMVKTLGVEKEVVFAGGVAKNSGVKRELERFLGIQFSPIPQDPQILGALGAALIAWQNNERRA